MLTIPTSQGNVNISVPDTIQWRPELDPRPVTNVGIKISGGTDSALLAYILALYKRDTKPEIKLIPITTVKPLKPYHEIFAKRVVSKISELSGVSFEPHIVQYANPKNIIIQEQIDFIMQLYNDNLLDCHFYGETLNPDPNDPEFVALRTDMNWSTDRDVLADTMNSTRSFRPFRQINKRAIHEIYNHYGILEELFPLTRSCEARKPPYAGPEWMDNHCQQCWFCNERFWGFGRYV